MNDWEKLHRQAERYKLSYLPGTRVVLLQMNWDVFIDYLWKHRKQVYQWHDSIG